MKHVKKIAVNVQKKKDNCVNVVVLGRCDKTPHFSIIFTVLRLYLDEMIKEKFIFYLGISSGRGLARIHQ